MIESTKALPLDTDAGTSIKCSGVRLHANNISADVTSLMRVNYSGAEGFFILHTHNNKLPKANPWRQNAQAHNLFLAYTRVYPQKLILGITGLIGAY